jgi:predicted RNase H-like HicB family nuclease
MMDTKHMKATFSFTYWKESDGRYLGYLNDYPDHWTQGETLEDLKE